MSNIVPQISQLLALTGLLFAAGPASSQTDVEGLGRLFIDADQREKLEAVRRGTYKAETEQESRVSNVRVNGIMVRSNGDNVVWFNGVNSMEGEPIQGLSVKPESADPDTYKVRVVIDGKQVKIKPGQNWSEGTGTVKDNY